MIGSTLFGVPLGTYFTQLGSWRWTFWGIGFMALLMLAAIYFGVSKEQPKMDVLASPVRSILSQFRTALSNLSVLLALLASLLWFGGLQGMFVLISELSPTIRGTVLSLNSSAMYAGMMGTTAISAVLLYDGNFIQIGILCAVATLLVLPITLFLKKEQTIADSNVKAIH